MLSGGGSVAAADVAAMKKLCQTPCTPFVCGVYLSMCVCVCVFVFVFV